MPANVGSVSNAGQNPGNNTVQKRPAEITVKKGENLTVIAQRFGMSKADFIKWTGLTGYVYVGQKIVLPTAKVEKGKGIYALAREYNMTMDEFCKLNNISDRHNYNAKADEVFYVTNKKVTQPKKKVTKTTKKDNQPKTDTSAVAAGAAIGAAVGVVVENKRKWGSSYTPEELSEKIFELSGKYYGAVGKPDFDALINEINPKNASAVIEAYTKNKKNKDKESLINTIASEIKSSKQARKDAIMKVYDALAQEKGAPASKRDEFVKELDKQFDKWVGMVNTEKLDAMLLEIMGNSAPSASSTPYTSTAALSKSDAKGSQSVHVPGSKYPQTVSSLHQQAVNGKVKELQEDFKKYCQAHNIKYSPDLLDTAPLKRIPKPVLDGNGNIVPYVSDLLKPTGKPNGKVIVLNSGHGGYNPKNGVFDVGSYSFVKKGNGKYAPHLEYEKVQPYVNDMADKLRAQGYAVVITQGSFVAYSNTKALTHIYNDLESGKKAGGHKYDKKDIAFVSFHADSSDLQDDNNDLSSVCYKPGNAATKALADTINYNLNHYEGTWVKSELAERVPGTNGVYILNESTPQVPTVLLETAHINGVKGRANLDSYQFRQQFIESTLRGLNDYFGIN